MIQAVIFDLDGTLIDSNEAHVESWQRAFDHWGLHFTRAELHAQVGKGSDQYLPCFLSPEQLRTIGPQIDKYRSDLFQTEYLPRLRAFPGVRELLARIKAEGKRVALASSGKAADVTSYKKIAQIEDLVDCEVTADDTSQSKPAPDVFAAALEKLDHLPGAHARAVGDSPYDVEAAKKIGLATICLRCGGFAESLLENAGAIAMYQDPADLLAHYESSPLAR